MRVIRSLHGIFAKPVPGRTPPSPPLIPAGLKGPLRFGQHQEGGTLAYLISIGGRRIIFFGSMSTTRDINQMMAQQHADLAGAVATASKAAYTKHGWNSDDLTPATDLAQQAGAEVQVTSRKGTVIAATPGYIPYGHGPRMTRQIFVGGHDVGWVTVTFDKTGLSAAVMRFKSSRWPIRF